MQRIKKNVFLVFVDVSVQNKEENYLRFVLLTTAFEMPLFCIYEFYLLIFVFVFTIKYFSFVIETCFRSIMKVM